MLGLKDVLPKDLRNNRLDLGMNIVKEEMMFVGVREAGLQNVVRQRLIINYLQLLQEKGPEGKMKDTFALQSKKASPKNVA